MRKRPQYLIVFSYIIRQIYYGELVVGQPLASVKSMAGQYGISENTARRVVKLLSECGFIKTSVGKSPVLVSKTGVLPEKESQVRYQVEHTSETYQLVQLILPSIAAYSISRYEAEDFTALDHAVEQIQQTQNMMEFRVKRLHFINILIARVDNTLIEEVYQNTEEKLILAQMLWRAGEQPEDRLWKTKAQYLQSVRRVSQYARSGLFDRLKAELSLLYTWHQGAASSDMADSEGRACTEEQERFDYFFYYDLIVSDLLDQIFSGEYQIGQTLPPVNAMIERYQVSVPTVRSAYSTLCEAGLAKTVNGRGTYLILYKGYSNEYGATLEGMQRLVRLWEAHQMLVILIGELAVHLAASITRADAEQLERRLRVLWRKPGRSVYPVFLLLSWLFGYSKNQQLNNLYIFLKKELIFNLYLERRIPDFESVLQHRMIACLAALEELKAGRAGAFAQQLSTILSDILENVRQGSGYYGLDLAG